MADARQAACRSRAAARIGRWRRRRCWTPADSAAGRRDAAHVALARTIEAEIIPRLMLAHRAGRGAGPRPRGRRCRQPSRRRRLRQLVLGADDGASLEPRRRAARRAALPLETLYLDCWRRRRASSATLGRRPVRFHRGHRRPAAGCSRCCANSRPTFAAARSPRAARAPRRCSCRRPASSTPSAWSMVGRVLPPRRLGRVGRPLRVGADARRLRRAASGSTSSASRSAASRICRRAGRAIRAMRQSLAQPRRRRHGRRPAVRRASGTRRRASAPMRRRPMDAEASRRPNACSRLRSRR